MMETQEKTPPKFEHSAVASLARVWRFREHGTIYSEEYTLAMPNSFTFKFVESKSRLKSPLTRQKRNWVERQIRPIG